MKPKRIEELDENLKVAAMEASPQWRWLDAATARVERRGLGWFSENQGGTGRAWSRLPHRAQGLVRDAVWELSQSPAGVHLAFRSDTTRFAVRARTTGTEAMPHMPSTGSRGLQLFCGPAHRMRPLATAVPEPSSEVFERSLFQNLAPQMREFKLYLPLYNPLDRLEIGLDKGARLLAPTSPELKKPIVYYGTSITQGGCASAAGHDFVSTLGRLLNMEIINLGFSGNGRGEPELARLLAEIDASLYVLDYVANTDAALLRRTLPRFVAILRELRPEVPVLLQTNLCFSQYGSGGESWKGYEEQRDIMMEFYAGRRKRGDFGIHLVDGFGLLPYGVDGAYVDGIHPTDHGFALMAERLAPAIQRVLFRDS